MMAGMYINQYNRKTKVEILKKIKAGIFSPDLLNFEFGCYRKIKDDIYEPWESDSGKECRYSELMQIIEKNNLIRTTPISFVDTDRPESEYPDLITILPVMR